MTRRKWLATTAAGWLGPPLRSITAPPDDFHVSSDVHPLRRVLVHEPGPETRKALAPIGSEHPLHAFDLLAREATAQHRRFVEILTTNGVEVVRFLDVFQAAIAAARAAGEFAPWLARSFPKLPDPEAITGEVLIGADARFVFPPTRPGEPSVPLVDPLKFLFYTRDLGVMTPKGLVVANLGIATRDAEIALLKFLLIWAPQFADCPVAFDAVEEEVQLQGGDLIVADARTLLLGVGNLTEERAAALLAERLEIDVIAVQLAGPSNGRVRRNGNLRLRQVFLHLDTIFNFVDSRTVLAVPYFLDEAQAARDPLSSLVKGLVRAGYIEPALGAETLNQVKQIGTIRRYEAGTGELDPAWKGRKLLDFVRSRGYRIVSVGGTAEGIEPVEHLVENVLHELRFQAANVLALAPGRVLAHEANERTNAALRAAGVTVTTFPASELVRWQGGAHCMSLPLARSPI